MNDQPESSAPQRLGLLRPKDTTQVVRRGAAYSRVVGVLRWVLPSLVLLGLAGLIVWPMISAERFSTALVERVPNLMVEDLHLTGLDSRNQAYSLTAARALQAKGAKNKNTVDLEKPEAEISLDNGTWLAGKATYGRLDQTEQKLWLGGTVEFFHDKGYRFISDEANIDMEKNTAWGEKPVLLQGSFGEIRGQGFRFLDGGKVFVVTGKSSARLDLQPSGGSDKPSGNHSTSR